ncbi:CBO0543 family protein [Aquibacillus saliphilus]|uniref:CBO0543 family protein n=1 Tax=Aquibacillus saliphilus TaxID=1909422 RepID=UPI001CEFCE7D|nr:CBO0543 family protein [Aquibacillus saliphilus]
MDSQQREYFQEIISIQEKFTKESEQYWQLYSNLGTWQFWVILLMLLVPLIILYFVIDREKIFLIGFFGFAVHVLFFYTDAIGIRYGLWGYPYQMVPFLPSFSIDASIVPISIMLVYQWTLKHNKNFFVYLLITSLVFGFAFKPLLTSLGLFESYKWINFFLIFLIYVVLFLLAYLITKIFVVMHKRHND